MPSPHYEENDKSLFWFISMDWNNPKCITLHYALCVINNQEWEFSYFLHLVYFYIVYNQ